MPGIYFIVTKHYGPFCHGAFKLGVSTLFTPFFVLTSLQFILYITINSKWFYFFICVRVEHDTQYHADQERCNAFSNTNYVWFSKLSNWPVCVLLYSVRVDPGFRSGWPVCLFYTAFELTQDSGVIDQYVCFIQRLSWPRIPEWLTNMSVFIQRSSWPMILEWVTSMSNLYSVRVDPWFRSDWAVCLFYTAFELTQDSGVIDQYVCFIQRSSWPSNPEWLTSMSVLYSVRVDPGFRSGWPVWRQEDATDI